MDITFSIIAPIYNEIGNLADLYSRLKEVMDSTGESWEFILVDDGSTDGSIDAIRRSRPPRPGGDLCPEFWSSNCSHRRIGL